METFFDEVFTPGWAYKFISVTKLYAYPKPFLKDKKVKKNDLPPLTFDERMIILIL